MSIITKNSFHFQVENKLCLKWSTASRPTEYSVIGQSRGSRTSPLVTVINCPVNTLQRAGQSLCVIVISDGNTDMSVCLFVEGHNRFNQHIFFIFFKAEACTLPDLPRRRSRTVRPTCSTGMQAVPGWKERHMASAHVPLCRDSCRESRRSSRGQRFLLHLEPCTPSMKTSEREEEER